jgi:hypothetical protein
MKMYNATGIVWGKYWGGGEGGYTATKIYGETSKEKLLGKANQMLKDGTLDSGMGYEELLGAKLEIEEVDQRTFDKKLFTHREFETEYIGKLSGETIEFLETIDL